MKRRSLTLISFVALFAAVSGVFLSSEAFAQDEDSENVGLMILDALVLRPISVGASCLTTALYLGTFPMSYLLGQSKEAEEKLVEKPWRFTHGRALGELSRFRDDVPEMGGPSLSKPSTY